MIVIFKTRNFLVTTPKHPHVSRKDGGHIIIAPKKHFSDRTELPHDLARELMKLTIVVGRAMKTVLNKHGVDIMRINYQENGNWIPKLHEHLYGRAKSAKKQKYGKALSFPSNPKYYEKNLTLTKKDVFEINRMIKKLLMEEYIHF